MPIATPAQCRGEAKWRRRDKRSSKCKVLKVQSRRSQESSRLDERRHVTTKRLCHVLSIRLSKVPTPPDNEPVVQSKHFQANDARGVESGCGE